MDYYSVSRLKTYKTCSMKYRYEYVDGIKTFSASKSTTIGSIVHNALEIYYLLPKLDREPLIQYFDTAVASYISSSKLDKVIDESILQLLNKYSVGLANLLRRADPSYTGKDSIRKRDGTPASNPSMTGEWKSGFQALGLGDLHKSLCLYLDNQLTSMSGEDFIDAYSEAKYLCDTYLPSPYLDNAVAVEMAISKRKGNEIINPVKMPSKHGGRKGIYLLGFIDIVSELDDGSLLLADHKTSSSAFTGNDVRHNAQLLSYAYAYEQITGRRPEYIGINNIRDRDVIMVETPSAKEGMDILDSLFSCHKLINDEVWIKHSPEPYSPCVSMYGSVCPHLSKCWPNYLP